MTTEDEVRKASQQFYAALNQMANGDSGPMAGVWSHSKSATTMHPIGGRDIGWGSIKEAFDKVGQLASDGKVELKDQFIQITGDVALEIGNEQGHFTLAGKKIDIEHRVTNIYQRESGAWKVTHHHTDLSPAMIDVLSNLK